MASCYECSVLLLTAGSCLQAGLQCLLSLQTGSAAFLDIYNLHFYETVKWEAASGSCVVQGAVPAAVMSQATSNKHLPDSACVSTLAEYLQWLSAHSVC